MRVECAARVAAFPGSLFSSGAVGALQEEKHMEQRWSLRKPVTFDVQVSRKCHPHVRSRSRNISLEGLFIETGLVILPVGCCIDVEFALTTAGGPVRVRMPAVVVHRTRDGCGIVFHAFNTHVFRSIERMLYAPDDQFTPPPRRPRSTAVPGRLCSA
jgi:hypothetical protein